MVSAAGTTDRLSFAAALTADGAGTSGVSAGRAGAVSFGRLEGARGGAPVLVLSGELDLAAADQVRAAVEDLWALTPPAGRGAPSDLAGAPTPYAEYVGGFLVVDLSGLLFIDVSGLRVLHRLRQVAAGHEMALMLVGVGPRTRWLMDLAVYDSWWRE